MIFALASIIFGISYGIYLACRNGNQSENPPNENLATNSPNENLVTDTTDGNLVTNSPDGNDDLKTISRDKWFAKRPINQSLLELPSEFIIIAHTVGSECSLQVFSFQTFRIKYFFFVFKYLCVFYFCLGYVQQKS